MSRLQRMMGRLEVMVGAAALRSHRRPLAAVGVVVLLSAAGLWASGRLTLDADLTDLLPRSFRSVQDLDTLRERFGGIGYVVVVGRGAEPEALRRFADDLAPKLEALEGIRFVEARRATDFFTERALYYLSLEDLQEVQARIKARERWERRQHNPLLLKLDDEPAPPLDFADIEARYSGTSSRRLAGRTEDQGYYLDAKERMVILLAKPAGLSADLAYSKRIVERVEALLAAQDLKRYGPGFEAALTGTFKKKIDQQSQISRDLAVSSAVAGVVMLLYLVLHFRSFVAVPMVLIPVGIGLTWTYGFVGLAYGSVNLLTAFLGAVLGGLGTEHGIHLLGRFAALRREGRDPEQATREAFAHTGVSALVSSLVAALTFLSLALSEFRAFREFGVIAAVGMVLVLVAYLLVLPATLSLSSRFRWTTWAAHATAPARSERAALLPRWAHRIVWMAVPLAILMALQIPRLRFDYDFSALEDGSLPSFVLDRATNRLLGYSQTPTVILTDSLQEERHLVGQIQERRRRYAEASTVDFAAALGDLVPDRQDEKREVLQAIDRTLARVDRDALSPALAADLDTFRRAAATPPFTADDIPRSVRRQFESARGEQGGFVLVFPRVSMSDGEKVLAFSRELRGLELADHRPARAAGEAMILSDIIDMVTRESGPVLIAAVGLVLLALFLTLGSLREALVCLAPTAASIVVLLGVMAMAGLRFNFLNIVAVPVLIGTTVDGGVHLMSRLREAGDLHFGDVLAETGHAINGGLITSAVGFAALTMADHPGLRSLGLLTILGFSVNLLIMLVAFPAALLLYRRRQARAMAVAVEES
jgi:predicted RND superfamily exporter protein